MGRSVMIDMFSIEEAIGILHLKLDIIHDIITSEELKAERLLFLVSQVRSLQGALGFKSVFKLPQNPRCNTYILLPHNSPTFLNKG